MVSARRHAQHCACGPHCTCKNCTCSPAARTLDALGNETRLQLVLTLREGPKTVTELATATGTEQSAVSHGLKALEACGLVMSAHEGKYRRYSLAQVVAPLLGLVDEHLKGQTISNAKTCCCH